MIFNGFPNADKAGPEVPAWAAGDPVADTPAPDNPVTDPADRVADTPTPGSPVPADPIPGDRLSSVLMTDYYDDDTQGMTKQEQAHLGDAIERIARIPDPVNRATAAAQALDVLEIHGRVTRRIRRRAIGELLAMGKGVAETARLVGVSESTVKTVRESLKQDD